MKKTNVAVGVIIALGVIWTGAAWLSMCFSSCLPVNHAAPVQITPSAIITPTATLVFFKISYQDYQRGVFSSKANLVIQASSQTEDNALLKPRKHSAGYWRSAPAGPCVFRAACR
jgi:uncharacterized protein YdgA (DUF945 family)